ncbi:unnamed protein product [Menidia menidia]|uniref:long-chain-fatty-acid--CoA ligase n=1 Tax=Menidia menidia TaxID=238744 RepID=A0A8S4BTN4_9TELE|nr:unnamed protein product [Menidia menidia]
MLSQELLQMLKLPHLDDVTQYIRTASTPVLVSVGAVAAATTYYLATRPKAPPPICDLQMQSVEIPWTMTELACYTYSLVSVPLYDTLGKEAIGYILEKADKVSMVLDCVKDVKHSVKTIVLMETPSDHLVERGQMAGIHILSLQEMEGCMLVQGARIGFFQGDIRKLPDDLNTLKPTMFPVVPRLLNRMYDKIFGQANSPVKRWLLNFAYRRKQAEMSKGIMRRDSIWDRLIFRKVQASLGGHVRLMLTGAAPISPTVLTFLRAALGCQFYEGYGQTECTAGCTMTTPGDWSAVKLVDVPEMNYLAVNGEGEVCVKGANVFLGYLNDPEKTAEAIDADGWLHTGDIGKWLPNGTLKIVDRKKHIFKLAQGEYIAPEKIENIYIRSDAVAQVFVHGDSLQAHLIAVVVPDPDFLSSWTKRTLGLQGSYEELCSKADVKVAILEDMLRLGKEGGLKSFEQVKDIYIHTELFSIDNGLLTPTMKAKRNELLQHFRSQLDELYAGTKM